MASTVKKLTDKGLISPPKWLPNAIQYEVMCGSISYGVSSDSSDMDITGFCIPTKDIVFPNSAGLIQDFDKLPVFDQWEQHHIIDKGAGKEYDVTIYNIIKFFKLCMDGNPDKIDALFVPDRCILHMTPIAKNIRDNRDAFLHKGCWHKFKGYATSQLLKLERNPVGKRKELVDRLGWDTKFGYHIVRLLDEIEQIMVTGTLDIEKNREQLKSIRKGEWKLERLKSYSLDKIEQLGEIYLKSEMREKPDYDTIKRVLVETLEHYYSTLEGCLVVPDKASKALYEIQQIIERAMV